jgi:hypothetical protein
LPNDIFDVILDAEESGGVCRRRQGKATRFGVPDTADVREESQDSILGMFPPLRHSLSAGAGGIGGGSKSSLSRDNNGDFDDYKRMPSR